MGQTGVPARSSLLLRGISERCAEKGGAFVLRTCYWGARQPAAEARSAHGVQCSALRGPDRWAVSSSAARIWSVVGGVSANAVLAEGRLCRVAGGGCALAPARVGRARGPAPLRDASTVERCSQRPSRERGRATTGPNGGGTGGPHRGRHPGPSVALTVTPADQGGREQVAALAEQSSRSPVAPWSSPMSIRVHRTQRRRSRAAVRTKAGGGQTSHGKTRVRAAAQTLGGRTKLRLAARFRRLARDYERLDTTLKGLHLLAFATTHAAKPSENSQLKFLTGATYRQPAGSRERMRPIGQKCTGGDFGRIS